MHGYMNVEALKKTIETKEAHYWSRSRKQIWHKGKTSGFVQKVKEIRIDDDQDSVWLSVDLSAFNFFKKFFSSLLFFRDIGVLNSIFNVSDND